MFEQFKNDKTKECEVEQEQEYECPVGTVPLGRLKRGAYFYTFMIVNDKPVPSCLYRVVGKWLPSNRIAALGWATNEDDGEHLTEFDPDRMVMPVVVDDIPTIHNTHIEDLVVDEEGIEVYRVAGLLVDDNHDVIGLRLETPSWDPFSDYIFKKVLLTDKPKYRKIVSLRNAIRKHDWEVL
jgi:hypothetical protein